MIGRGRYSRPLRQEGREELAVETERCGARYAAHAHALFSFAREHASSTHERVSKKDFLLRSADRHDGQYKRRSLVNSFLQQLSVVVLEH